MFENLSVKSTLLAMATFSLRGVNAEDAVFLCRIIAVAEDYNVEEVSVEDSMGFENYSQIIEEEFEEMEVWAPLAKDGRYNTTIKVRKVWGSIYAVIVDYSDPFGANQREVEYIDKSISAMSILSGDTALKSIEPAKFSEADVKSFAHKYGYVFSHLDKEGDDVNAVWAYKFGDKGFRYSKNRVLFSREDKEIFHVRTEGGFTLGDGISDVRQWSISKKYSLSEKNIALFAEKAGLNTLDSHGEIRLFDGKNFENSKVKIFFSLDCKKRGENSLFYPTLKNGLTNDSGERILSSFVDEEIGK